MRKLIIAMMLLPMFREAQQGTADSSTGPEGNRGDTWTGVVTATTGHFTPVQGIFALVPPDIL
jgi:hypothetical protein